MFEEKIHNGFLLCSFALVMLVMSGLGLSLFIDGGVNRFGLEQDVVEQRQKITDLEQFVGCLEEKQATADFLASIDQDQLGALQARKHVLLASLKNIRSAQRDAEAELESVEKEFGTYREKARKLLWSRSVGYRFGSLTIEYDRTYEGVRIAEISEHGVKITHDGGTSFIPSTNMPAFLQEKFQLVSATGPCCHGKPAP